MHMTGRIVKGQQAWLNEPFGIISFSLKHTCASLNISLRSRMRQSQHTGKHKALKHSTDHQIRINQCTLTASWPSYVLNVVLFHLFHFRHRAVLLRRSFHVDFSFYIFFYVYMISEFWDSFLTFNHPNIYVIKRICLFIMWMFLIETHTWILPRPIH